MECAVTRLVDVLFYIIYSGLTVPSGLLCCGLRLRRFDCGLQ